MTPAMWLAVSFALLSTVANAGTDTILIKGTRAGSQSVAAVGTGARVEYSYNDRGRGDHIVATWKLDAAGVPTEYSARGNDYMKAAVRETFRLSAGKALWQSGAEHGEAASVGEAFYWPSHAPPEFTGVLARALLVAPDHRLRLLPAGEARIAAAGEVEVSGVGGGRVSLTQYQISGLGLTPSPVWLDGQRHTAAIVGGWMSVIEDAYAGDVEPLKIAQQTANNAWSADLARRATHVPSGDVWIRHARLFDPRDLVVRDAMSVLIRGERIIRIAQDADVKSVAGAQVIDAAGRFLMPGLWDNHQHFDQVDGALDLSNGVTSARDMANDTDAFLERVARFDAGSELGPRVFKAGVIDGNGPFAAPTKMRADTPAEALQDVGWYAEHGYGQIKIYSSVKPELVPIIADEAHARGLRVSGHVPAYMSARQFVEAGADEIQHLNFIVLNFLFDQVKDTRGTARFTAVAEHAHEFGPDNPQVAEFIGFIAAHHTVLDPTMNVFEAMFSGRVNAVTPGLESVAPRFPAQERRHLLSEALEPPKGQEAAYAAAFPAMLKLLKALHDAGVTIIPGTDSLAGYSLLHELELYVRAGFPAGEVLRMATLTSARVVGLDRDRGVLAPGKLADLILVDGDPSLRIEDIRNVSLVMKGGHWFDPAEIERGLSIEPREPTTAR